MLFGNIMLRASGFQLIPIGLLTRVNIVYGKRGKVDF